MLILSTGMRAQEEINELAKDPKWFSEGHPDDIAEYYAYQHIRAQEARGISVNFSRSGGTIPLTDGTILQLTSEQQENEFKWYFKHVDHTPRGPLRTIAIDYKALATLGGGRIA